MTDTTFQSLALAYLQGKANWSRIWDEWMKQAPRAEVKRFESPRAAADYYIGKGNLYTGDPLFGALDYYTNPNRLQAALYVGVTPWNHLHIDCDDVAGYYLASIRHLPGMDARIYSLIDERFSFNNASHVICVGSWNGSAFGLDVNGYRDLPDLSEDTLCRVWNEIYGSLGVNYKMALQSPYPF